MTFCAVSGMVISLLVLLGLLPVGVDASYEAGAFSLKIRLGPVPFQVLPKKPGDRKYRNKSPLPGENKEEPFRLPALPVLKALALRGCEALCRAVRRARVDTLRLHYTAGGPDPYGAALAYGAAGAAMEGLLALSGGRIAHPDLRAEVDFDGGEPVFSGTIVAALRLYQAAAIGGRFALGFWGDWRAYRKNRKGAEDSE